MNKKILFLICILTRICFSILIKKNKKNKYINIFTFLIALSFFTLYIFDLRKKGIEATNNIIWWNEFRPIHGSLYLLFSIYYYKEKNFSWVILLIDSILGIIFYSTEKLLN